MQTQINISEPTDSVETYEFEPIQGYPMLNWKGKRPFRSTQYYPAQLKETYGEEVDGWRNKIYWGDNLQVMSHLLKTYRGKINLIYIDPPFDSKADYKKRIELRGEKIENDRIAFEEKQYTDIWTNDEYLQFMYERLILLRELLTDNGSIYVHCDPTAGHYIKVIMDEVFGNEYFRNEIVWYYKNASRGKSQFAHAHDTVFWYGLTPDYTFNREDILVPFESGMTAWRYSKGGQLGKTAPKGKTPDDIITIPSLNTMANERLDYPTQKPEELLECIIKASSNPGDLVFDCFMGSGTTQAVAMKLGRRFIGADINLGAVETTSKRLLNLATDVQGSMAQSKIAPNQEGTEGTLTGYAGFEIYNVNHYDVFRNPDEAKDLLIEALEIQPLPAGGIYDGEKDGRMVKIMPINRIATRADLNELITGFNYPEFQRRQEQHPTRPVEKLLLVCMGHEPDLAAVLKNEVPHTIEVEVMDILRDKSKLEFKRESKAKIVRSNGQLIIEQFYPMNLFH